ncbi:transcription factor DIVARICATA-like [Solanum pennellii]|uniref:Transcription factor DIVARICATA-like n=1 Tax=Solanum pennellii TaxID=28526 RepID=A0ABM1GSK8_SOLPN|nr:transcription factor DIVARICATA-like [Solanum pennellii]
MGDSNGSFKLFGVTINNDENEDSVSVSQKKGKRWSEEEHRAFLCGLEELGTGNWSEIAKQFVPSRTRTQISSHAQKYFAWQKAKNDKAAKSTSNVDSSSPTSGKEDSNEERPLSPMPISYSVPNVSNNGDSVNLLSRKQEGKWTEEEHEAFLIGMEKVGRNWTRVSKEFVQSRTPTQITSHAQKYFESLRNNRGPKRSVFDITLEQESTSTCPESVTKGKQVLK